MSNRESYKGSCFCGAVKFTVSGEPALVWGIVIANPADTGRLAPSILSPCGVQTKFA